MALSCMEILKALQQAGKFVCVGLDSDPAKIPKAAQRGSVEQTLLVFNQHIIEATAGLVCAYKPNVAFYAAFGDRGYYALKCTIDTIRIHAPGVPVILDCKRGDIGNTNNGYVAEAFDYFGADAVTLSPYMGIGSLQPFLDRPDKGVFIICRTSNPEAAELQDLEIHNPEYIADSHLRQQVTPSHAVAYRARRSVRLFEHVAHLAFTQWNRNHNLGLVFGATNPEQLASGRALIGNMPILIPAIGAQGGDLEKAIKAGQDFAGLGFLINLSRSVIFASANEDFAQAARAEVIRVNDLIHQYKTTA